MRAAKKVLGGLGVFLFVANSAISAPAMRGGIPQDIEDLREAIAELQDRTAELEQTFPIGLVNIVRSLCRYISAQGLPPTEACEPYLGFFPTKTVFVTSQTFNQEPECDRTGRLHRRTRRQQRVVMHRTRLGRVTFLNRAQSQS
jgi:hypothetical protein